MLLAAQLGVVAPASAQSLRGSSASLDRQNRQARAHDFSRLQDRAHVQRFVDAGLLVRVGSTADYEVHRVSFPYARPEVRLFIQRLAAQYRRACEEKLVVTSLTRPWTHQPRNASDRSVHPTGMAVDLRRSNRRACRAWLENTLLHLEGAGVLDATRERWPPHYHVALFPRPYASYVDRMASRSAAQDGAGDEGTEYRVRAGDSLWEIARAHGVSVATVRVANRLSGNRIYPGQLLTIPGSDRMVESTTLAYRVQRGDSLWEIARAHRTTVDRIRAENDLDSARIYAGQLLQVPAGH